MWEGPEAPGGAQEVGIAGLEVLASSRVQEAWRRREVYPALGGLGNPQGRTCFAASVAQVLLRVPAVIVWLERHAELCALKMAGGCAVCALRETRRQVGVGGVEPVVCRRDFLRQVGAMFADGRQHDACEFAHALLVRMVNAEADAGRLGVWPGTEWGVATHVDRLCSFVEETRRVCGNCGSGVKKFGMNRMLVLSLAGFSDERSWGVSELYVKYCSKEEVRMDCGVCDRQGGSFQEQRRVVMLPNVLVVQVKRAMGAGAGRAVCRTRVEAEREFSVPGSYEVMELWVSCTMRGRRRTPGITGLRCEGQTGCFGFLTIWRHRWRCQRTCRGTE